ncbi:DnaB-like helicase C-terminal domain-containing protein [Bacillus cereus]|uniref:DnaB-like helicase C-terminal domain-containing protein n=1 Tax=Bacillus thuringiensis TaxID=1428 RepID=UPI002DBD39DD|nr:DnaB-like helicase C-terminal domain-containing protein [Bacillus cereus]
MTIINYQEVDTDNSTLNQDEEIFTINIENPLKVCLRNPEKIFNRPINFIEQKMLKTVRDVDDYSWNRDARGGLKSGFPLFDEAIEGGVQAGLYLIAAQPNVGKSAWMLQVGQNIANLNKNAHVAYHSLDDSVNELTPRYIACKQQITISQAKNPARYMNEPEVIEKRNEGVKHLYRNASRFSLWDSTEGTSVEAIEKRIQDLKMAFPDKELVLMIDSIYDLTVESKQLQDKNLYEYVARTVKQWCVTYDLAIFCTAHLRKLGGNRRPLTEDLKENNRLEYEANFIALLYNEVGIKEEGAQVYWLNEDTEEKMPVIEMKVGKNKLGSFKGTHFYEFVPNMSFCMEASIESRRRYASLVYQS